MYSKYEYKYTSTVYCPSTYCCVRVHSHSYLQNCQDMELWKRRKHCLFRFPKRNTTINYFFWNSVCLYLFVAFNYSIRLWVQAREFSNYSSVWVSRVQLWSLAAGTFLYEYSIRVQVYLCRFSYSIYFLVYIIYLYSWFLYALFYT